MKLFYSVTLFACLCHLKSQNLIHNAGFENSANGSWPTDQADVGGFIEVWEDEILDVSTLFHPNCNINFLHSPDWYVTSSFKLKTSIGANLVNARNGSGYLGMGDAELIEQQLFSSDPLINGKEYEVSLYFQFPGSCCAWDNNGCEVSPIGIPPLSNMNLKVFMATHKIKYKNDHQPNCDDTNPSVETWMHTADFFDHKDGVLHDHTVIGDFTLNTANYAVGQWHRLSARFTVPNDGKNYDWVAFEVQGNGSYIIIDDAQLIRSCELGCTNVSNGPPEPLIGSYPQGGPKCMGAVITNIQNVETLKIEVIDGLGQTIRTQQFSNNNGFSSPVYWDGLTDNLAGPAATAGLYLLRLTCTNACGTFTFSQQVSNPGCNNYPLEINAPYNVTSSDIQVFDCCELDIAINNKSFGPGPAYSPNVWRYRPRNTITLNTCTIPSGSSKVELIAGETISILETAISPTANDFEAYIQLCPDAHKTSAVFSEMLASEEGESQSQRIHDTPGELKELSIAPNPSADGKFTILNANSGEKIKIYIYGSMGNRIKESEGSILIDLGDLNKGLYLAEIYVGDSRITRKLIYN